MHEYDTVLKSLLTGSENSIFERITGARRGRWLNVELPEVTQTRVDLLFEAVEEKHRLISMELQSHNDALLPLRMAEYALRVYRRHKQFPEQYVLYVGSEEMRMPSVLEGPNLNCRYRIVDIRSWDAEMLVNSPFPADVVMAILGRYAERPEIIERILMRISKLERGAGVAAFSKLMILAGIRGLEGTVETGAKHMPILNDIMDHGVIGPAIQKGLEQGLEQGRRDEALAMLRRQITKRFGPLSTSFGQRLEQLSLSELEDLGERFVDATSMADLFESH